MASAVSSQDVIHSESRSRQKCLLVSRPVTLTWQEISVYVKTECQGPVPSADGQALKYAMACRSARSSGALSPDSRATLSGSNAVDRAPSSAGQNNNSEAREAEKRSGDRAGVSDSLKVLEQPFPTTSDDRPEAEPHFQDTNESAITDGTDSSDAFAEEARNRDQGHLIQNELDSASAKRQDTNPHRTKKHIADCDGAGEAQEEDEEEVIKESDIGLELTEEAQDQNVNHPGSLKMGKREESPEIEEEGARTSQDQGSNKSSKDQTKSQGQGQGQVYENDHDTSAVGKSFTNKNGTPTNENEEEERRRSPCVDPTGAKADKADDGASSSRTKQFFEPVVYNIPTDEDAAGRLKKTSDSKSPDTGDNVRTLASMVQQRRQKKSKHWKPILKGLTGIAEPGTLLAVMGASGSGKTTLMNVLAGRNVAKSHVSGTVRANGITMPGGKVRQLCAYAPQHPLFLPNLTVKETLAFRATLEVKGSSQNRERLVQDILHDLALTKAANTLVGNPGGSRGISGGERQRLSFACELLVNPPLILCDEPTSGLDSGMAERTVRVLQSLADLRHTVICTIHQPSSLTFAYFHRVLLLAEGRTAFLGTSSQALEFLASQGYVCPRNYNPADFFIHALSAHTQSGPHSPVHKAEELEAAFLKTAPAQKMLTTIHKITYSSLSQGQGSYNASSSAAVGLGGGGAGGGGAGGGMWRRPSATWLVQLRANLWRFWTCTKREKDKLWAKFFSCAVIALVMVVIFYRLDLDAEGNHGYTQINVLNVNGVMFLLVSNFCYITVQRVIGFFPLWVPVVLREHRSGLYRLSAFYAAASLVNVPLQMAAPLLTWLLTWWLTGMSLVVDSVLLSLAVVILASSTSVAFGMAVSTTAGDVDLALTVSGTVMLPLLLLSGFVTNLRTLPVWLGGIKYLSWMFHTYELLMVSQWAPVESITCGSSSHNNSSNSSSTGCLVSDGDDVLRTFGLSEDNVSRDFLLMAALMVVFHCMALLALHLRARRLRA